MEQAKPQGQKPNSDQERKGKTDHDKVAEGKNPPSKESKFLELLLKSDQWGLLPPKLQEEVRNSEGKEFPLEYREIIYKYYQKMADMVNKERQTAEE